MNIGMADNGDFFRVIVQNNLYSLNSDGSNDYFGYFIKNYGIREYYNELDAAKSIKTTQNIFVALAVKLGKLVTHDNVFDIRFLAFIQMILCIIAIYMVVDYLTYKKTGIKGYIIAILTVIIFADTAYSAYFNSFYAEGIVYTTFIIAMSSVLLLSQKRYNKYILMIIFFLSSVVLIGVKQQNAPLGVFIAILCVIIAIKSNTKLFKSIALIGAGGLVVCSVLVYVLIPKEFVYINQYHAMTRGVLMTSDNPEKTLEEFNIDKQYSLLTGSLYYERYPAVNVESQELINNFYSKYGFLSISLYYIKHPGQLMKMLDIAAKNAYSTRPDYIGNYEKAKGKAWGEKTNFFIMYSSLKKNITPKTMGFIMLWSILAIILSRKNEAKMIVIIISILMGLSQMGVSIIGAGDADIAKHIFLYTVVFDFINLMGLSYAIERICNAFNRTKMI
jgi:hypothetical protein